jgi:hypothetical protein
VHQLSRYEQAGRCISCGRRGTHVPESTSITPTSNTHFSEYVISHASSVYIQSLIPFPPLYPIHHALLWNLPRETCCTTAAAASHRFPKRAGDGCRDDLQLVMMIEGFFIATGAPKRHRVVVQISHCTKSNTKSDASGCSLLALHPRNTWREAHPLQISQLSSARRGPKSA